MNTFFKVEAVLFVLLAVVAMAIFPAVRGPYSATHGPVTTLRTRWLNLVEKLKSNPENQRASNQAPRLSFYATRLSPLFVSPTESTASCVLRI